MGTKREQAMAIVDAWDMTLHSPTDHEDARNNLIDRITAALEGQDDIEKARAVVQELWRCGYLNNPSDERAKKAAQYIATSEWKSEQPERQET